MPDELEEPSGQKPQAPGGHMGELIRTYDWAATPLGPMATWPQSLKVAVRLLLNTRHPMFIWWGPELIQFYNDAYAESLGPEKHPSALGAPGRGTWPEIWDVIGPQIEQVMAGGEATWHEDQLVPIIRYGAADQVYWTYSFSPIDDGSAPTGVGGVLVICRETTPEVLARREREEQYQALFNSIEAGFCIVEVRFNASGVAEDYRVIEANPAFEQQTGLYGAQGRWLRELAPALEEHWYQTYGRVALTGQPERFEAGSEALGRWFDVYAFRTGDPHSRRVAILFNDISARRTTEQALRESEERFQSLAQAVDQVFHIADLAAGKLLYVSPAYERIWGRSPAPLFEDLCHLLDAVHPEDRALVAAAQARPFENAQNEVEYRIIRPDGGVRWIRDRVFPSNAFNQRRGWLVGIADDISEKREAEEALHKLNADLEQRVTEKTAERNRVWEMSQDLFAIMGFDGILKVINPAWTATLGYDEATLLSRSFSEQVHPDDHAAVRELIERLRRGEVVSRFEDRIRHADGSWRWIAWSLVPEPGQDVFYAVGRDVTAEKEAAAELEAVQEALRQSQKMEAMGQLTGGVAHDFNNLLTPIIGSLDRLVTRGMGSERERRLMAGALESAERAKTLVQRLLAFARRQPLQPVAVDVGALMEGLVGLISSTLGPRIDIELDFAEDLPPARTDPNQLEMALLNLAVNARDAMPEGGQLTIAASRASVPGRHPAKLKRGHYVRLSVTDTGLGMDEATLARAVEPFFSTKGIGKGTGLGLSMVHGLAAQLGGGLVIHSKPGQGTSVELWMPISTEPVDGKAREQVTPPPVTSRGCALLVDDEDLVRMSTADMLADLGFDVLEAGTAEDALRLLQEGTIVDLLITDHLMPGMTGADLARQAQLLRPGLPVLIVSGYAEVEGLAPDLPRLVKPFRIAELAERVGALVPSDAPVS